MNKIVLIILVIIFAIWAVIVIEKTETQVDNDFKIGAILTLTGPGAFFGEETLNGMKLANKEAGLDIIYEDSQTDPQTGLSAFNKLVDRDKVDMVITTFSSVSSAVLPEAKRRNIPTLITSVSSTKVARLSDLGFRYFTSGEQEGPLMAEYAYKTLNLRTVSTLYIDDEYGLSYHNAFKQKFEELGGEVIEEETFPRGSVDFRTQLTKIKGSDSDGLYFIGFETDTIALFKQRVELDLDQTIMTNWVLSPPAVKETGGASDGTYLTSPSFHFDDKSVEQQRFFDRYVEEYGEEPSAFAVVGYDLIGILELVKDKDTPEEIAETMRSTKEFDAMMGELIFTKDGDISFPLFPAQVVDGEIVRVEY